MRASFIVAIVGLAVAAAGITEWASRRALKPKVQVVQETPAPVSRAAESDRADTQAAAFTRPAATPGTDSGTSSDGTRMVLVLGGAGMAFRANAQSLSEPMVDAIDQVFAGPSGPELICAHFVIEGHTDNLGSAEVNRQIGLSRALAVKEHLTERYQIPRDAMKVVSYGGDQPVGDNATPEGRSMNRRVVIRTIAHAH
jgi:outer membrane protein OmpA-like peptidoglycan-associated protein